MPIGAVYRELADHPTPMRSALGYEVGGPAAQLPRERMSGYDARRPIILTAPETASARSGGKMLRRPTLDEFMLAAFAGAVFIIVQFGSDGMAATRHRLPKR